MDYTVLARRFRPQAFDQVVGQERVSQALRNAISGDRVAHAYLFTGARGVGKTSMARILAKTLNCPNSTDGNPCNQCEVCESISAGNDVDVLEIDGASARGIDDVRQIKANVGIRSMRSQYKIYVVDEVHMLTKEAFNALLKTLEEPPPNVKFIFCTTDPQKLPDTILSRCQRFDFGTIATLSIMQRLREIATAEGVEVDEQAIELVARRAAGSMRDSQSLFDQLLAFGGKEIVASDVHRLLGTAPDERLIELGQAFIERRRDAALIFLDTALGNGVQLSELVDQLIAYVRDLMVLATEAMQVPLLSVADSHRAHLASQAKTWGLGTTLAALQILTETKTRLKGGAFGRPLAELALVRIAGLEDLESLAQVLQLAKAGKLTGGTASSSRAVGGGTPLKLVSKPVPPATESPSLSQVPAPSEGISGNDPGSETPQKKSEPSASSPIENQPALVPFEPGNETSIMSQVVSMFTDMSGGQLKSYSNAAISGPNHLVITFPKRYDTARRALERPEELARIERAVERVVGIRVRVQLRQDTVVAETAAPAPPPVRSQNTFNPEDLQHDAFLKTAVDVFNATVFKSERIAQEVAEEEAISTPEPE